jgi:RimK family alpha-L-glutamate ligase
MRFAVIGRADSDTNVGLAARGWAGVPGEVMSPRDALRQLRAGDVALNRLDVLPSADGVEDGLWIVNQLMAQDVRVLNTPSALLAGHDKLLTARLLDGACLPHPRTVRLAGAQSVAGMRFPLVAKPRFGSWGVGVERCDDRRALQAYVDALVWRPWRRRGAIAQELVRTSLMSDLRIIVAAGQVVGAASRTPPPGEWRTNVALGGAIAPALPDAEACALARATVSVLGLDLAGVDLLPVGSGWIVLEVNAAVEFRPVYSPSGDAFGDAADALSAARFLVQA